MSQGLTVYGISSADGVELQGVEEAETLKDSPIKHTPYKVRRTEPDM